MHLPEFLGVVIDIVCVLDNTNGVLKVFKTWIFMLASLEINCSSDKHAVFIVLNERSNQIQVMFPPVFSSQSVIFYL